MRVICVVIFLGALHHQTHGQDATTMKATPTTATTVKLDTPPPSATIKPESPQTTGKPSADLTSLTPSSTVSISTKAAATGKTEAGPKPATSTSTLKSTATTATTKDSATTQSPTTTHPQEVPTQSPSAAVTSSTVKPAVDTTTSSPLKPTTKPPLVLASAPSTDTNKPILNTTQSSTEAVPITSTAHVVTSFLTTPLSSGDHVSSTTTNTPTEKTFLYDFADSAAERDTGNDIYHQMCKKLVEGLQVENCTLTVITGGRDPVFKSAVIQVKPTFLNEIYKNQTKKPANNASLITILCCCIALLVIISGVIFYAIYHCRSRRKDQHLTEELQTVENGYHDNPTLEVMEVHPEMQEKKAGLNGDCNDSWIVPIDNLAKEDLPDEEDTHL
ncbi:podocalyxin-like isoform X2 [Megalops cyprinoides]|uniref:podocalyxin-like isoform X2 n=1 Tax=Megalops cyprinoides TaxID=118141 RepID=UPI0018643C59|nr:podocalyxin-like isoform X2 [Megalops cyprinoides]